MGTLIVYTQELLLSILASEHFIAFTGNVTNNHVCLLIQYNPALYMVIEQAIVALDMRSIHYWKEDIGARFYK